MSKKLKTILLSIVIVAAAFFVYCNPKVVGHLTTDMGFYSGDTDYGWDDGGSSWGDDDDGWSWGDDDDGWSWGDDDDGDDYYSSSTSGGSGGSGSDLKWWQGLIALIVFIAPFVAVVCLIEYLMNNGLPFVGRNRRNKVILNKVNSTSTPLRPISDYTRIDPSFSEEEFKEKLSNIYIQMQNAWTDKDITPVRPYFTDALYNQFDRQLDSLRNNNQTNHVDRIAVLGVDINGFRQEKDADVIVVTLNTRIVDYTVDDKTGVVVSGDKKKEKFMTYEYELSRKTGTKTDEVGDGIKAITCPKCGANVEINASAKCPYCGSVLTTNNTGWAIRNIKGVAQRTR